MTYEFFTTADCTGSSTTEQVTVNADGSVPNSTLKTTLGAGSYSYFAIYNGNQNYNPTTGTPTVQTCEPFTINKKTPTISTTVLDGSGTPVAGPVALGTSIKDSSTLTNGVGGFPLGGSGGDAATVTYEFFTTADCTGAHTDESVAVAANGTVPNSTLKTTLGAGSYSYFAIYNGNQNYNPTTGTPTVQTCEPFTVNKKTPTISTTVLDGTGTPVAGPVALGTSIKDSSTLSNGQAGFPFGNGTLSGGDAATVTYEFFTTANCTGSPTLEQVTVNADGSCPTRR